MIIINVDTDRGNLIELGRRGEYGVREIWFDLTYLIDSYGEGTATLSYVRPTENTPYIVNASQEDNRLAWNVDGTDTAFDGIGKCEIRWSVEGNLAKTIIYRTMVKQSLTGERPDSGEEDWYDKMIDYIDDKVVDSQEYAQAAAQSASDASDSATAASASAQDAEAAKQAVLETHVRISLAGNGTVTIGGALEGGQ